MALAVSHWHRTKEAGINSKLAYVEFVVDRVAV